MPYVTLAVPQSSETVTRSVIRSVVNDLMTDIEFPSDTDVIYREDIGAPPTTGGTLNKVPQLRLTGDNHVVVKSEELFTESGVITSVVYKEEYPYIYIDKKHGIYIKPTYGTVTNTLNIKLYFRDKSMGDRYRRVLRIRGGLKNHARAHEIRYDYSLPDEILAFLNDAHAMIEPVGGVPKPTLAEYLNSCFMGGLVRRKTQAGNTFRLALEEVQGNIIGMFSEELFYNELTFEDGYYSAEFTYSFSYNHILGFVMEYPNIIHNKRIPKMYRKAWAPTSVTDFQESLLVHRTVSYMPPIWLSKVNGLSRMAGGYRVDPTDDWLPATNTPNTLTIVMAPVIVDPVKPHEVLNINDFTDEQLPPDIKDHILTYKEDVTTLLKSPYLIQVFNVGEKTVDASIEIDDTGNVTTVYPMEPSERHYFRASMMVDFSKLPYEAVDKMLNDPERTVAAFKNLNAAVDTESGEWLKVVGGKKVTVNSFRQSIKKLPTSNGEFRDIHESHPRYISNHIIRTRANERR